MIHAWNTTIPSVMAPNMVFCRNRNVMPVSAWAPRKTGAEKASPKNSPSGSTSSLMTLEISDGLTWRILPIG